MIFVLGHHFLPTYVWRTDLHARGRGGALVTAFDAARVGERERPDRLQADARRERPTSRSAASGCGTTTGSSSTPSCPSPRRSASASPFIPTTRRRTSRSAASRASCPARRRSSEPGSWPATVPPGASICASARVSEMGGTETVNRVIDTFGPQDRIVYVHFRDVQGVVPRFQESFLGEGNYDPAAVLSRLAAVGFDGFLIDDHVPAMIGDEDTWANTTSAAYCSRGRAHAIGYLQGLLHALDGAMVSA